jgi:hypothetical protein
MIAANAYERIFGTTTPRANRFPPKHLLTATRSEANCAMNNEVTANEDDLLADAHEAENDLPGDQLGGGLGNADGGEPASDG